MSVHVISHILKYFDNYFVLLFISFCELKSIILRRPSRHHKTDESIHSAEKIQNPGYTGFWFQRYFILRDNIHEALGEI